MSKKEIAENRITFDVETTEFGTPERKRNRRKDLTPEERNYHGKRRACPCDILWRLRDKFGCWHEVAYQARAEF